MDLTVETIALGTSLSVYRSAQVFNVDPFCLKTAQKAMTTEKIASIAAIGFFSSAGALYNKFP